MYESNSYMDTGGLGEPISVSTHRMEEGRPWVSFMALSLSACRKTDCS